MILSNVKNISIPEGNVIRIKSGDVILWEKDCCVTAGDVLSAPAANIPILLYQPGDNNNRMVYLKNTNNVLYNMKPQSLDLSYVWSLEDAGNDTYYLKSMQTELYVETPATNDSTPTPIPISTSKGRILFTGVEDSTDLNLYLAQSADYDGICYYNTLTKNSIVVGRSGSGHWSQWQFKLAILS